MPNALRRSRTIVVVFLFWQLLPAVIAHALSQEPVPANLLQPADITYLGAFRMPEVTTDAPASWEWSGEAMAFFPDGDPGGGNDGFPGSLFATGLATENHVSEISIPAPSLSRTVEDLPRAQTLHGFTDVRQGLFANFTELPRVGLEVLPAQTGQSSGKLYLAWGQHHHDQYSENTGPTHAWCDTDLSNPSTQGAWWVGPEDQAQTGFIYSVNGYLFAIADQWADDNVGGMRLATGRYRDGGWSGMGPTLVAIGPWLDGSPPAANAELSYQTLLLYAYTQEDPTGPRLNGYAHSDEWKGGAWIEAGGSSAVVFVGTKGSGYNWYGYYTPDGVPAPPLYDGLAPCAHGEGGEYMCYQPDGVTPCTTAELELCAGATVEVESKGWWSSRFDAQMIFYDPADLAAVAAGTMQPSEPQPYAALDIDEHLFLNATAGDVTMFIGLGDQRLSRVGETAYDRSNNLLYVLEIFANEYEPVVHVFRVEAGSAPDTYRLTVTKSGTGSGTVTSSPAGINCGTDCSQDYAAGTSVTLSATPAAGSTFSGWSGACSGSGTCTVTMNAARSVGASFAGSTTFDYNYVVPVVAHSSGAEGSEWRSDLVALNSSGSSANLELRLLTSSGGITASASLAAGATVEWADIIVEVFGVSPSQSAAGALHLASDTMLRLASRTYNQGEEGTFGQYLPAVTVTEALARSDRGYLINLKGGDFRSNVGFVNLGGGNCTVELVLYDANGSRLGQAEQVNVPSGRWTQMNDVFATVGAQQQALAYAMIEVLSGNGTVWAYASVVDNVTSDPTTIPVQVE